MCDRIWRTEGKQRTGWKVVFKVKNRYYSTHTLSEIEDGSVKNFNTKFSLIDHLMFNEDVLGKVTVFRHLLHARRFSSYIIENVNRNGIPSYLLRMLHILRSNENKIQVVILKVKLTGEVYEADFGTMGYVFPDSQVFGYCGSRVKIIKEVENYCF